MQGESFDYSKAGVNIEAGDALVQRIKRMIGNNFRPGVLTEIGGFAGFFKPDWKRYREPVLAAAADGVGTKLKIAAILEKHDTVGIDLVAMCVNDLLVQGADPIFFLDYLAMGKLDVDQAEQIISGIVEGCSRAGCALLGGETAEMPGFYPPGEYDLAGFAVGIAEKKDILTGKEIIPGDVVIGLASNGLHSNGFSLVRKVLFEYAALDPGRSYGFLQCSLGEELLKPTLIYVPLVLPLLQQYPLKGLAHITGGGLELNLLRVLPPGTRAVLEKKRWVVPAIFNLVQERGNIEEREMYRTFNMGIGMAMVVPAAVSGEILDSIRGKGQQAWVIGYIDDNEGKEATVTIT
ncbi:MAG: phosphoribosylformylglycinamidine cyclo-ligase [Bacillota bacterium]